ncbi:hypothetical protein [Actinacidiphila glaucinigra]|uniref:hypothetical protein n=1 Tax=Actinacidiphila glaucinigra TaxID=235986 RepID=UPI0015C62D43|nr:hypothetical protein [Actinacidiphila glaucinigra]
MITDPGAVRLIDRHGVVGVRGPDHPARHLGVLHDAGILPTASAVAPRVLPRSDPGGGPRDADHRHVA